MSTVHAYSHTCIFTHTCPHTASICGYLMSRGANHWALVSKFKRDLDNMCWVALHLVLRIDLGRGWVENMSWINTMLLGPSEWNAFMMRACGGPDAQVPSATWQWLHLWRCAIFHPIKTYWWRWGWNLFLVLPTSDCTGCVFGLFFSLLLFLNLSSFLLHGRETPQTRTCALCLHGWCSHACKQVQTCREVHNQSVVVRPVTPQKMLNHKEWLL